MSQFHFTNRFSNAKIAGRPSIRKAVVCLSILLFTVIIGGTAPYAGGTAEGKAEEKSHENHIIIAEISEARDNKIINIKSENLTPETSPEEFWERFKEESRNKGINFDSFMKKVTRGLMVELKSEESGRLIIMNHSLG